MKGNRSLGNRIEKFLILHEAKAFEINDLMCCIWGKTFVKNTPKHSLSKQSKVLRASLDRVGKEMEDARLGFLRRAKEGGRVIAWTFERTNGDASFYTERLENLNQRRNRAKGYMKSYARGIQNCAEHKLLPPSALGIEGDKAVKLLKAATDEIKEAS